MSDYQADAPDPKKIPLETQLVNAAEAGDLDTLFELLAQGRGLYKYRYPAYLRHAQGVVADRGSGVLLDTLLRRMVQYDAEFLLRAQFGITQSIRSMDAQFGLQGGLPQDVVEEGLPRLVRIEDRLLLLARTYATIKHLLNVAERPPRAKNVLPLESAQNEPDVAIGT
jgi:hypothetical protein